METLARAVAVNTVHDCVCARCHGDLEMVASIATNGAFDFQNVIVRCKSCRANTPGYITKAHIKAMEKKSKQEALDVARNYPELAGKPIKPPSDDPLDELGFGKD